MPSYHDVDDDMPDFDAMLGDFEGPHVPGEYKAMLTIKVDAKTYLYPGCKKKYSKLSATLLLLRFKAENGLSNKGMTDLLTRLHDMFPKNNVLPVTNNKAMKVVCPLSLEVQKIHACVNDCMLYDGPDKDLRECRICHHPRYKRKLAKDKDKTDDEIKTGIPFKVVWYLPLIPRLKCLFANPKEAEQLRWHKTRKIFEAPDRCCSVGRNR